MSVLDTLETLGERPGFRCVSFGEVGLPLWWITATVLCVRTTERSVVEGFLLRLLGVGIDSPSDMGGILGLSAEVVVAGLSELIRNDEIKVVRDGIQAGNVALTEKGKEAAQAQVALRPREEELSFYVDGLTGHIVRPPEAEVYTPRQAKAAGLGIIRHFPLRAPEAVELPVTDFTPMRPKGAKSDVDELRVLRVKSIGQSERRYRASTALAFKSEHGNVAQVAFVCDGRLSETHEAAFARVRGQEKVEQFMDLLKPAEALRPSELCGGPTPEIDEAVKNGAEAASAAQCSGGSGWTSGIVEVFQHPKLLQEAVEDARTRLVIVSPWIRAGVVTPQFADRLEDALGRGAEVWIGYGLGEDRDASPSDVSALRRLEALGKKYSRMICRKFGDTHSKVLIKDDEWYVITSFNWLSYRGDPRRPFREELGQLMRGKDHVDALWRKLRARFES